MLIRTSNLESGTAIETRFQVAREAEGKDHRFLLAAFACPAEGRGGLIAWKFPNGLRFLAVLDVCAPMSCRIAMPHEHALAPTKAQKDRFSTSDVPPHQQVWMWNLLAKISSSLQEEVLRFAPSIPLVTLSCCWQTAGKEWPELGHLAMRPSMDLSRE